jgi:hypothetical protein
VKFSVKSIYPISTSSHAANCQASWEFAGVGVEYLFMADGSQRQSQNSEGSDDFRYISFDRPNGKAKINIRSGRYKRKNVVLQ